MKFMRPGETSAAMALLCLLTLGAAPSVAAPPITRQAVFGATASGPNPKSPLSLARDEKSGDLLLSSFETAEIFVLNDAGTVIKTIGKESGLVSPYGVAVDAQGRILVTDLQPGQLVVLSPGGQVMDRIDLSALRGRQVSPGRITVGADGRIYVVDLQQNEILVLQPDGTLLKTLGPFDYLQKAGPMADGQVIGLSAQGTGVTIFDADGSAVRSFGKHGDVSEQTLSFPTGFAIDSKQRLWIADAFQHRLKVFSLDGQFLFNYGRMEEKSGGFFFPVDLCFGEDGRLFVLEKGANRVQIFLVDDLIPAKEVQE